MMTKKHYQEIAGVFAGDYASSGTDAERRKVVGLALSLSDVFRRDNPAFDRVRFLKACGLTREDAAVSLAGGKASWNWSNLPVPGDRIRLTEMPSDPAPLAVGEEGVVGQVGPEFQGSTQVSVRWDSGRTLGLVVPPDRFEVVGHEAVPEPWASTRVRDWTCQHGAIRRGYVKPAANCEKAAVTGCAWTDEVTP